MEDSEKLVALESEEQKDEALQLAENMEIEQEQKEKMDNEFVEKRNLLTKNKNCSSNMVNCRNLSEN